MNSLIISEHKFKSHDINSLYEISPKIIISLQRICILARNIIMAYEAICVLSYLSHNIALYYVANAIKK